MKTHILLIIVLVCWGTTPIIEKIGLRTATPFAGVTIRSAAITIGLFVMMFFGVDTTRACEGLSCEQYSILKAAIPLPIDLKLEYHGTVCRQVHHTTRETIHQKWIGRSFEFFFTLAGSASKYTVPSTF